MASPAPRSNGPDPSLVYPPEADPIAIRACLPPAVAAVFDAEWEYTLEQAKQSKDLAGVRELLGHWRHFAYQELRSPGSYFRVLTVAAQAQATWIAPAGSVGTEEMRARIEARLRTVSGAERDETGGQ